MKSASNTLMLLVILLSLVTGCATTKIPNIRFYAEIPFVDGPEGAWAETLTRKSGIIPAAEWAKIRPFMIMVDPDGKKEIFRQWSEACRWAGHNKTQCNVQMDTSRTVIEKLDDFARAVMGPIKK